MKLSILTTEREGDWDVFVESHLEGSPYFKTAWRDTILNEFNHKAYFIFVESKGNILAVLPLFIIDSLFSKKLISIPYCPYGGVLSKNEKASRLLIQDALQLGKKIETTYIELKCYHSRNENFSIVSNYITFHLSLEGDISVLKSKFSKNTKRNINKGKKLDYKISIDSNIDVFYDLYNDHMRKIGTPSLSKGFFSKMYKNFESEFKVATIWYNDIPAASIILLFSNDSIIYDRGATNYELRNLSLNYVLFWELISKYSNKTYKTFDFGRSVVESGTYQFKNGWRPEIKSLNYEYYVYKGKLPEYSQESHKRKIFTKIFRKLPNIPFLNYQLRKNLP